MADPVVDGSEKSKVLDGGLQSDPTSSSGHESSIFSATFGTLSGRLQKAVNMATSSSRPPSVSSNSSTSSTDSKNQSDDPPLNENGATDRADDCSQLVGTNPKDVDRDPQEDHPSETESITSHSSTEANDLQEQEEEQERDHLNQTEANDNCDEMSLMEAKVQILYGQLHAREAIIEQLKNDYYNTRQEFETFEKDSAECMEELSSEIHILTERLLDKEDRIRELESLQVIPEPHFEGPEELLAELKNLKQLLKEREETIQRLEENTPKQQQDQSIKIEAEVSSRCIADLQAELEAKEKKLRENSHILENLEESDNLNFSLILQRDDEIERLNARIHALSTKLDEATKKNESSSSQLDDALLEIAKLSEKDQANETLLQEQKARIDQLTANGDAQEDATKEALDKILLEETDILSNLLLERETECNRLKTAIEKLERKNEANEALLTDQTIKIENLSKIIEENDDTRGAVSGMNNLLMMRESQCRKLQNEIDGLKEKVSKYEATREHLLEEKNAQDLSTEATIIQELKRQLESQRVHAAVLEEEKKTIEQCLEESKRISNSNGSRMKELSSLLQEEKELCEQLGKKIESLSSDLLERNKRISDLGFKSELELISSYRESEMRLMAREEEIRALSQRQLTEADRSQASGASVSTDLNLPDEGAPCGNSDKDCGDTKYTCSPEELSEEDPKSVESLLDQQKGLRKEAEAKIKSLASEIRNWDTGGANTTRDIASFSSFLSGHIQAIVVDLKAQDEVGDALITAYQLNIRHTSSLEKELEARKIQIEMLIEELEDQQKDNLGTSMNSEVSTGSHSLMLSSKLEQLLDDIRERDEKLKVLEWITKNLSNTLDSKTSELEQFQVASGEEKQKLERRVNLLLNDVHDRDVQIHGLKELLDAYEESKKKYDESQREGFQELLDSLAIDLQAAEKKISVLEEERESNTNAVQLREAELLQEVAKYQKSFNAEKARKEALEVQISILNSALLDRSDEIDSLQQEINANREMESKIAVLEEELRDKYDEVDNLSCTMATKNQLIDELVLEKESKMDDCQNLEYEVASLVDALKVRDHQINELESEHAARQEASRQQERKLQDTIDVNNNQLRNADQKNTELSGQIEVLKAQNSKLLSEVQSLQKNLKEIPTLHDQITQLETKNADLLKEVQSQSSKLEKKKNLGTELSAIQDQNVQLVVELSGLKEVNAQLGCELTEVREKNAQLRVEVSDMKEQKAELESIRGNLENQLDVWRERTNNLEKDLEKQIIELEHALEESKTQRDNASHLESRLDELMDENAKLVRDLQAQLEESSRLSSSVGRLTAELREQELRSIEYQKSQESTKCQLEGLQEEKRRLCAEILSLNEQHERKLSIGMRQLESLKLKNTKLLEDLALRDEQLQEASQCANQLSELKALNAELLSDLQGWENRVTELECLLSCKDEVFKEMSVVEQLLEDQKSQHQKLQEEVNTLTITLEEKEAELASLRETNQKNQVQTAELEQKNREKEDLSKLYEKKQDDCRQLEDKLKALTLDLNTAKDEIRRGEEATQASSQWNEQLQQEISRLREQVKDLDSQVDKLSKERAALVDQLDATKKSNGKDKRDLSKQQQQQQRLLENMESLAKVLEERERQLETLEAENKLKEEFVTELQKKNDEQSNNMDSLMEEHEQTCSELSKKLDTMASENDMVRRQLRAMGFHSMDALVHALALKCQEHRELERIITEHEKQIKALHKDPDRAKAAKRSGQDTLIQENLILQHKVRELEMKIDIFRDEIAGKNDVIRDLTLSLNAYSTNEEENADFLLDNHNQSPPSNNISTKDAPGLRIKRVSVTTTKTKSQPQANNKVTFDESDAKTAKALSTIPSLLEALKQRDATIERLQREIASNTRTIDALAKGLEDNVQEKIAANKLVHESKTKCSKFASRVQHLSKKLEEREQILEKLEKHKSNCRPMTRNLATIDEIKALSTNELINLLTQSRVLAEDLEQERERLIANATNMSIALAESRSKVDELMSKLDPLPSKSGTTAIAAATASNTQNNNKGTPGTGSNNKEAKNNQTTGGTDTSVTSSISSKEERPPEVKNRRRAKRSLFV